MKAENHLKAGDDYRRVLQKLDPVRDLRSYAALAFHASLHYIAYICDAKLGEHRDVHSGLSRFLRERELADLAGVFDEISSIRVGCVYGGKLGRNVADKLQFLFREVVERVEVLRKAPLGGGMKPLKLSQQDVRVLKMSVEALSKIDAVKAVILFGSLARGEQTPRSDIDLMVVLDCEEPYEYLSQVCGALGEVAVKSHRDITPLLTNLRDQPEDFLDDIVREGILLYGELTWKGERIVPKLLT